MDVNEFIERSEMVGRVHCVEKIQYQKAKTNLNTSNLITDSSLIAILPSVCKMENKHAASKLWEL